MAPCSEDHCDKHAKPHYQHCSELLLQNENSETTHTEWVSPAITDCRQNCMELDAREAYPGTTQYFEGLLFFALHLVVSTSLLCCIPNYMTETRGCPESIWRHKTSLQLLRKQGAVPIPKQGFCRFPDRATTTLNSGPPGGSKPACAEMVPSPQYIPSYQGHCRYPRVGFLKWAAL